MDHAKSVRTNECLVTLVAPENLITAQEEKMAMLTEEQVDLDETMLKLLGEAIFKRNPYGKDMQLATNWQYDIEEDSYEIGSWRFKDRSPRVAKAIRIPYTYKNEANNIVKEYLLIGYEGSGGE
jgi:hypothetical protein